MQPLCSLAHATGLDDRHQSVEIAQLVPSLVLSISIRPPLPMFWLFRDDEIDLVDDHHSPDVCWQQALPRIDMVLSTQTYRTPFP